MMSCVITANQNVRGQRGYTGGSVAAGEEALLNGAPLLGERLRLVSGWYDQPGGR